MAGWTISNINGNTSGSTTGTGNQLLTQDIDLYQPESWDAWRKFQTNTYYTPEKLTSLINNTVSPGITDRMNQRIAEANRASGPMPLGGTSGYSAMMRDRAIRDAMKEESSMRSQLAYDWSNKGADKAFEALGMQPVKKAVYRPTPASSFSSDMGGGYGGGSSSARRDVQMPFNTASMGWNNSSPSSGGGGAYGGSNGYIGYGTTYNPTATYQEPQSNPWDWYQSGKPTSADLWNQGAAIPQEQVASYFNDMPYNEQEEWG